LVGEDQLKRKVNNMLEQNETNEINKLHNMNIKAPHINETIQHILEDYREELKHLTEEQRKTFIKQCEEKILEQPEKTNAH
jgi:type III secretory pathway component EscR